MHCRVATITPLQFGGRNLVSNDRNPRFCMNFVRDVGAIDVVSPKTHWNRLQLKPFLALELFVSLEPFAKGIASLGWVTTFARREVPVPASSPATRALGEKHASVRRPKLLPTLRRPPVVN